VDLTKALEKNFEKKNIRDLDRHQNNEKLKWKLTDVRCKMTDD
jgi:hypothetical protein